MTYRNRVQNDEVGRGYATRRSADLRSDGIRDIEVEDLQI